MAVFKYKNSDGVTKNMQQLVIKNVTNSLPIDNTLSDVSTNAVQNRIIKTELDKKVNTTTLEDGYYKKSETYSATALDLKIASDLANYYKKSESYSKSEIDNLLSTVSGLKFEIVTSLPTSGISASTIYLLTSDSKAQNLYKEYVYINNNWELLGSTDIDLSDYVSKIELNTILEDSQEVIISDTEPTKDYKIWVNTSEDNTDIDVTGIQDILNYYQRGEVDNLINDLKVVHFDGKSSTDNPNNLVLWQKILTSCLSENPTTTAVISDCQSNQTSVIFLADPDNVLSTEVQTQVFRIYSIPRKERYFLDPTKGSAIGFDKCYVEITVDESYETVTSVSEIIYTTSQSNRFLPTDSTAVKSYTPTYDYHPATKKYVDDKQSDGILTGSVLDYDGDTIPEGYEEIYDPNEKLLWTNPDMSSGAVMGETNITLSSDDYDYIVIYFLVDSLSGNCYLKSCKSLKGWAGLLDCNCSVTFGDKTKIMIAHRKFTYPNENDFKTIKFYNGEVQWPNDEASQSWRRTCYPIRIYGGKF